MTEHRPYSGLYSMAAGGRFGSDERDSQLQAPKNLAFCTFLQGVFPLQSYVYVLCRL